MRDLFPYDFNELVGGEVRALIAPLSIAMPAGVHEVIDVTATGNYAPKTAGTDAWRDFGATSGPAQYSRNLTVAGFNIQQERTALLEQPQEVTRTLQLQMAELSPENLAIFELAGTVEAIAAAAGHAAYRHTNVGGVTVLPNYRVAFIGMLNTQQGVVTEPDGTTKRGRLVGRVLPMCAITADNAQLSMGAGDLWSGPVSFKSFPDPNNPAATAEGYWFEEVAGAITSV